MIDEKATEEDVEPNLFALREQVPAAVAVAAEAYARRHSSEWPYGTYHPNDFVTRYEKGYLAGYLLRDQEAK